MGAAYSLDVGALTTTYCGVAGCGIAFAIPTAMEQARRRDGNNFYCPNGHVIHYGNSENERLKRDLATKQKHLEWAEQATKRAREQRDATEKSNRSLRGSRTRLKNRFAKGLCPHCSASFPNLAKHVQAMHPSASDKEGKQG